MVIDTVARTRLITAAEMRALTGFNASRDIADADLEAAIDRAQGSIVGGLANYATKVPLKGAVDGSNTRFEIDPLRVARIILDSNLDLATDASDVTVEARDDSTAPPTWTTPTVASIDARNGQITLSSAPAAGLSLFLTARLVGRPLDKDRVQNAIAYFAAHLAQASAVRAGKVNLANPQEDVRTERRGTDWMGLYKDEMRRLRATLPMSARQRVNLPGLDSLGRGRRHAP